jgi:hypothetical protein
MNVKVKNAAGTVDADDAWFTDSHGKNADLKAF